MAVTVVDSNTQTATIGTEHTLSTQTTSGIYVLEVDTHNMVNGDSLILKINVRMSGGGTWYCAYDTGCFSNAQPDPIKFSVPVPVDVGIQCTLKQVTGTGRSFDWKLLTV